MIAVIIMFSNSATVNISVVMYVYPHIFKLKFNFAYVSRRVHPRVCGPSDREAITNRPKLERGTVSAHIQLLKSLALEPSWREGLSLLTSTSSED